MSDETEPTGVRKWLVWHLSPLVEGSWRWIDSVTTPETIDRPTVNIIHRRIDPNTVVPQSDNLVNEVILRISSPLETFEKAEDALDDQVVDFIHALKASERLVFQWAEKVKPDDRPYLGWDIHIQVLSSPPTPPAEEE